LKRVEGSKKKWGQGGENAVGVFKKKIAKGLESLENAEKQREKSSKLTKRHVDPNQRNQRADPKWKSQVPWGGIKDTPPTQGKESEGKKG